MKFRSRFRFRFRSRDFRFRSPHFRIPIPLVARRPNDVTLSSDWSRPVTWAKYGSLIGYRPKGPPLLLTVIVYYTNQGSPWINDLSAAEKWLSGQETKRLESDNIKRPSTKWEFVSFFNVDVKVVLDRQPLLGTGPLPDCLRNLAHGRSMVALDNYQDNLSLWRFIAVH